MTDYTAAVIRLESAYETMQLARKRVADEIKARHRIEQRKEIDAAIRDVEIEFANLIAREAENGLPGNVIREEVLHTQDWGRWKKWRDLAGMEPDRVTRQNAKVERERRYEFNEDRTVLYWLKDASGNPLSPPVEFNSIDVTRLPFHAFPADVASATEAAGVNINTFIKTVINPIIESEFTN
jgi:hypothetical protein